MLTVSWRLTASRIALPVHGVSATRATTPELQSGWASRPDADPTRRALAPDAWAVNDVSHRRLLNAAHRPLRQTRAHLPRRHRRRLKQHLATRPVPCSTGHASIPG